MNLRKTVLYVHYPIAIRAGIKSIALGQTPVGCQKTKRWYINSHGN